MRLRSLRRLFSGNNIHHIAVRRVWPRPLRWGIAVVAVALCAALFFWAFECGRNAAVANAAGLSVREIAALQAEAGELRQALEQTQAAADAAAAIQTANQAAQDSLGERIRQLEAENASLREDLQLFEALVPAEGSAGLTIRGLQVEKVADATLRWQVLAIQAVRDAPLFKGNLQIELVGTRAGQPWKLELPEGLVPVEIQQYRRIEGRIQVPPDADVQGVSATIRADGEAKPVAVRTIQIQSAAAEGGT